MSYSVGQVSDLAGVTIRTLHHYDEIGLLSPSGRNAAGYRIYEEAHLERLRQILFYRELGFSLEEIAIIVEDPRIDVVGHLRHQRRMLIEKIERLSEMVVAIDREMEAKEMGKLTPKERFEVFGDFRPEDYAEEVEQRWGNTETFRQYQWRVASYNKEDWLKIKAEEKQVQANLAAAHAASLRPDSEEAMGGADAHRQYISRWFYECTYEIHRSLGDMYVNDERFQAYYDALAPGLAQFIRDAVHANANCAGTNC